MTCQILAKAVHNSVRFVAYRGPIYDRKVRRMLIQPASSRLGLVRGTVVLLENSITVRITEQYKHDHLEALSLQSLDMIAPQRSYLVICHYTIRVREEKTKKGR
ncbi:hypothetical protein TNCV_4694591 [Trichonephila clavipes]|nr:hypothetical protein TNCV_4694591 [Trichonephila clavipes]